MDYFKDYNYYRDASPEVKMIINYSKLYDKLNDTNKYNDDVLKLLDSEKPFINWMKTKHMTTEELISYVDYYQMDDDVIFFFTIINKDLRRITKHKKDDWEKYYCERLYIAEYDLDTKSINAKMHGFKYDNKIIVSRFSPPSYLGNYILEAMMDKTEKKLYESKMWNDMLFLTKDQFKYLRKLRDFKHF